MFLKKMIREAEPIPFGYGVAIHHIEYRTAECYPIPLNVIIGFFHRVYVWFRWGHGLYETGFERGYIEGKQKGEDFAFKQYRYHVIKQEVERLVRRGIDATMEIMKLPREEQEGYYWKVIEEERARLESLKGT